MKNIYITKEQRKLIASTPKKECWICHEVSNNIKKDKKGLFIPGNILNGGMLEHLDQIIERSK